MVGPAMARNLCGMSNVGMGRRWSFLLVIIQASIALLVMGSEECNDWHRYDDWQSVESRSPRPFTPVLDRGIQEAITVDHWPDARERTLHVLNFPASFLLGWYSHPLSIYADSLLGPSLLRLSRHISVKARVVLLDAVLLFGICLQWWLVAVWLEHAIPLARLLRGVVASMALIGVIMALLAAPRSFAESKAVDGTIAILSLIVACGWVLLTVAGTVSGMVLASRQMLQRLHG